MYPEYGWGMTQVTLDPKVTARALCACYKDKLYLEYGWGMIQVTAP